MFLLPEDASHRRRFTALWRFGLTPLVVLLSMLALGTPFTLTLSATQPQPSPLYGLSAALFIAPLLASTLALSRSFAPPRAARPWVLMLISAVFFGLSTGLLLFPLDYLPRAWVMLLIGLDLGCLGVLIIVVDAFDAGEAWQVELIGSLAVSTLMAVVFGGSVVLIATLEVGWTFMTMALLIANLTAAIGLAVFGDRWQGLLDRVIFARRPHLRQARADLRDVSSALPRVDSALDLLALDEAEFERLTPAERAVFLLREVFDYEYDEIADVLEKSEGACRKLFSRAKDYMAAHRPRFAPSPEEHHRLLKEFMNAVENGEVDGLMTKLAEDVTFWADGGGKVRGAAVQPVHGRETVARFVLGVTARFLPQGAQFEVANVNGQPTLLIRDAAGRPVIVVSIEVGPVVIRNIWVIANPDKLRAI